MADQVELETDTCILGAGPHGLAAAAHLRQANRRLDITVLDHRDRWLATWDEQFAKAQIETLRSPIVHHPCPDPGALMHYVDAKDLPRSGLPYDLPTATAFRAFCDQLIDDFELPDPVASTPHAMQSDGRSVILELGDRRITAKHVVVATNPHRRSIPDWTWPLIGHHPGLVEYATDVDLRRHDDLTGRTVAVIGGGLTAAHLACGAAGRGATVHTITRRPLDVRNFDTDPGWLGPKYLRDYSGVSDPERRLEMSREARSGGSVPPWMRDRLTTLAEAGSLHTHEATPVRSGEVRTTGDCRLHLEDGSHVDVDTVWLATGTTPDIHALRCLRPLLEDVPTLQGVPVVDDRLRLGPHPVFVTGRLATVPLGPAAGNLWGAQRSARRITRAITGVDLDLDTIGSTRPAERTSSPQRRTTP